MAECDLCGFPVGSDACNKAHNITADVWIPPAKVSLPPDPLGRYRHKKRGTVYDVLMLAENENRRGQLLVVYCGVDDRKVWARPASQFFDGRFEKV